MAPIYSTSSIAMRGMVIKPKQHKCGLNEASYHAFIAFLLNTIYISTPGPTKHCTMFYTLQLYMSHFIPAAMWHGVRESL